MAAAIKPQIRSMFATPLCVHFLPIAQEANADLRPLILERPAEGLSDFESWGGGHAGTLMRVVRELAESLTATRNGGRAAVDWKITSRAQLLKAGEFREAAASPGAFWAGVYFVDDGYQKSDDPALGGDIELADPRGVLPSMVAPQLGFRVPNGLTAGQSESIRPQSGMILLYPAFMARGEKRMEGNGTRLTIAFELAL